MIEKTAITKRIKDIDIELRAMRSEVLSITDRDNIMKVHANFATRKAKYIDLKNAVITSP